MDNLKNLRKEKGYSQAQIAQFLQVGTSVVTRWELGQTTPTPAQLVKLCLLFNCKPRQFFGCAEACPVNSVPVFEGDYIKFSEIPFDCSEKFSDFGIVLGNSLSSRFCQGDVCYFTIGDFDGKYDVVFAIDNECNGNVLFRNEMTSDIKPVAVCTALHQKL